MIILYRIYQLLIMAPLLLIATILATTCTIIGCALGGGRFWGYWPEVLWGKIFCWLTLVRVTIEGRENIAKSTSYVFVANHQGAYDIFSIYGYLGHEFRWMMKASLNKIPMVGYACEISKQVYVDKSSPTALRKTMSRAEKLLSDGMSIVVFPEGARTFDGKMRPFKRGAFMLAQEFNMPVVPITIDGAFDVLPRFKKIPRWGHIRITIHKPIVPGPEGHDMTKLIEDSHQIIEQSLR